MKTLVNILMSLSLTATFSLVANAQNTAETQSSDSAASNVDLVKIQTLGKRQALLQLKTDVFKKFIEADPYSRLTAPEVGAGIGAATPTVLLSVAIGTLSESGGTAPAPTKGFFRGFGIVTLISAAVGAVAGEITDMLDHADFKARYTARLKDLSKTQGALEQEKNKLVQEKKDIEAEEVLMAQTKAELN